MQIRVWLKWMCWIGIGLLVAGCTAAPAPKKSPSPLQSVTQTPKTLAILPFENNSITNPDQYAPLSRGLAAMLITDLKKSGSALKLIERSKIQALLKEIALSQGGSVDQATAVEVGRILGAQSIAFGSFMVLGSDVRMDVRIVQVETSELLISESISGKSDAFMELENRLAQKIAESMKITFQPEPAASEGSIDAAVYFAKGLEALDAGDRPGAEKLFARCVEMDSAYEKQVEKALEDVK